MNTLSIIIQDQHFVMHPLKVVYWEEKEALLAADVHLGKVSHFRKAGIAVPIGKMKEDVINLTQLLNEYQPKTVFFLGDLFHSDFNKEASYLEDVIENFSDVRFHLVTGNHDLPDFRAKMEERLQINDRLVLDRFLLSHQPDDSSPDLFQLCGHVHPAVRLKGPSKQHLKLPCFYMTGKRMILPSFGSFTGNRIMKPEKGSRVYVVAGTKVLEV
ncbi:MAG: ligase-associated DNA damage response endonuclease PdeM [bacterium]